MSSHQLSQRRILILGGGQMQEPLIREAHNAQMQVMVMDQNPNAPGACLLKDLGNDASFIHASIGDRAGAVRALEKILLNKNIAPPEAAVTVGNDHTPTVALLNERLSPPAPCLSYQDSLAASHKLTMRQRFTEHRINQPHYIGLERSLFHSNGAYTLDSSEEKALTALESSVGYPLVVKPAASMGSRGVIYVETRAELLSALRESLFFSHDRQAIVEQYLAGTELSIDALIFRGEIMIRGIAERIITGLPYFIEMGHFFPVQSLSQEQVKLCIKEFKRGIRALHIENGAAKGDLRFCNGKASIGEIAARLSGGFMSGWTTPYHTGANLMHAILEITLGIAPSTLRQWPPERRPAVLEHAIMGPINMADIATSRHTMYHKQPDTIQARIPEDRYILRSVSGMEAVRTLPGVRNLFIHAKLGQTLKPPRNNLMKAANVLITASHLSHAKTILAEVEKTLTFKVDKE